MSSAGRDVPAGPIRALHVLAPAPSGGLESVVRALARGLGDRGHRMTVAAVVGPEGDHPFVRETRASGIDVREVAVPTRAYGRERRAMRTLLDETGAVLVHTHGYRPDVIDAGVARRAGLPTVSTVHGFTGGPLRNRLYERIQLRALQRFDAVIAVSQPLEARLRQAGVRADRIHLVPNAWTGEAPLPRPQARQLLGLSESARVVGWVGRLSREKGPDLALRAIPSLPGDVRLSFIGDGPERDRLHHLAGELGVSDRVRWHGPIAGAGVLLGAFDALLLSSRTEGTPMVLFEALVASVPVVATAVGGIPAALPGGAGELVDPESPLALAEALTRALGETRNGSRSGDGLQAVLQGRLAWLERHEALYQRLARGGRS